jgi:hypothetical protein
VTITKAITIDGGGTFASTLSSLTNGVIVNAGATDSVILRDLSIDGVGNGLHGIRFLSGQRLRVENVTIFGITGDGIEVNKTSSGELTNARIMNSTFFSTGTGISASGGNICSTGDNRFAGNGANGTPSPHTGPGTITTQ